MVVGGLFYVQIHRRTTWSGRHAGASVEKPMQILLTGGTGQVGSSLRQLAPSGWSIEAPSKVALNLSDPASIEHAIASKPWDAVINAAAFTAVDKAEAHVLDAWQANALGPAILAHAT